jgi:ABC-type sugar transport system permease subunit
MSSTKKVRFALPLVMVVAVVVVMAVVALMAVVAVMAVAVVMAAAVMSVLVATAAVVMVVVAVVVVPVVVVAAVVAGVVSVSYGLAQSASNKELLTAQYRPPDDHLAEEVTLANLPENSAEWRDAPGMPNAITFRSQATVRVSSSRPRHQLKVKISCWPSSWPCLGLFLFSTRRRDFRSRPATRRKPLPSALWPLSAPLRYEGRWLRDWRGTIALVAIIAMRER